MSGTSLNSTGLPNTGTDPSPIVSQASTAKTANIAKSRPVLPV